MDNSYYIRVRGQVKGPYDSATLQAMARRSQFARHNEVSPDGETWYRASEFPELFPERAKRQSAPPREKGAVEARGSGDNPDSPESESTSAVMKSPESANEEARWFYGLNGKVVGAVSFNQLCELFKQGILTSKSFVWDPNIEWTKARDVPELAFLFTAESATETPPFPEIKLVPSRHAADSHATPVRLEPRRSIVFQILLIAGGVLMAISMFVPWWSLTFAADENETKGTWGKNVAGLMTARDQEIDSALELLRAATPSDSAEKKRQRERVNLLKIVRADKRWWKAHLKGGERTFEDNLASVAEQVDDNEQMMLSLRLWGWSEGIAIMAFVFGAVILFAVILFLCLPLIQIWNWIASIVASIFGVCAIIFSLLWIFSAPGDDAGGLTQGIIAGPYLLLGAAVVLFLVGLMDGIFGILAFTRYRRDMRRSEVLTV